MLTWKNQSFRLRVPPDNALIGTKAITITFRTDLNQINSKVVNIQIDFLCKDETMTVTDLPMQTVVLGTSTTFQFSPFTFALEKLGKVPPGLCDITYKLLDPPSFVQMDAETKTVKLAPVKVSDLTTSDPTEIFIKGEFEADTSISTLQKVLVKVIPGCPISTLLNNELKDL